MDLVDPSSVRGRHFYALDGTELADGADIAVIFAADQLPAGVELTVELVVEACRENRWVGDIYEVDSGELAGWSNWWDGYLPGQLRVPRPASGRLIGSLTV